ncbi:MAG: hypothetical protein IK020_04195 [Clostridiales bacterium]|nr:hypothetical protein [Clostridiales bacterium]
MKRNRLVIALSLCTAASMMLSACTSEKKENKGSSSNGSGKSTASETQDMTDTSDEEESTSSASESTVSASSGDSSSDAKEPDQVDGTTASTVTASSETASSAGTPSESKEESSSVLPSVATPISASSIQAGDVITFGSFEQDNDTSNGAEDIEWIVCTVEDGRALLLSKYVLYSMPYNSAGDVAWEDSDTRNWLNGDFYEAAFDESERASIYEVELETQEPGYSRNITTNDRVFLLELADIGKYFDGMEYWDDTYNVGTDCYELMTPATAYAEAHGAWNVTLNNKSAKKTITEHPELKGLVTCEWWLRETGAFCSIMGATLGNYYWEPGDVLINLYHPCDMEGTGIRPAIWVAVEQA